MAATAIERKLDLTRSAVIDVALAMADAEGLDAVTIRRLATHFGVTPMALYWHVKNKDELLEAMGDAVFEAIQLPAQDGRGWADQYHHLLLGLLDALRIHPGSVQLAGHRVLANDAGRVLTERALSLLRGAGLPVQQSADIARSSLQTMMMLVSAEPGAEREARPERRSEMLAEKTSALSALPRDRFPNLVECAAAFVNCDDAAGYYREGLALFMSGIRAAVSAADFR